MEVLSSITLVFTSLALFLGLRTIRSLRNRRLLRAGSSGVSCLVSVAIAIAGAMLLVSYLGYQRLTDEQLVAKIEFNRTTTDEYQARLMLTGLADQLFLLRGDEWQMDAKIVTWKPPLTILGLDPVFQLDRLSGRYAEISRERTEPRTVYSLTPAGPADMWNIARKYPRLMPGVDARYGTATFVPMADGARFDVSLSRDAIIARPANDLARAALGAWENQ